ncbi:MAG: four helix bundle protein [Agriterribacter sp.]
MRDFHDLPIWIRSHQLTLKIYNLTKSFHKEETFGLVSQMRAAYSIPSNIAEGCGRNSYADFKRFLIIFAGSSSKLEYRLFLSHDLGFIPVTSFKELETETILLRKMIHTLIRKLDDC